MLAAPGRLGSGRWTGERQQAALRRRPPSASSGHPMELATAPPAVSRAQECQELSGAALPQLRGARVATSARSAAAHTGCGGHPPRKVPCCRRSSDGGCGRPCRRVHQRRACTSLPWAARAKGRRPECLCSPRRQVKHLDSDTAGAAWSATDGAGEPPAPWALPWSWDRPVPGCPAARLAKGAAALGLNTSLAPGLACATGILGPLWMPGWLRPAHRHWPGHCRGASPTPRRSPRPARPARATRPATDSEAHGGQVPPWPALRGWRAR
mmetsp:Transcript_77826/g.241764  ORF Transcript_77826/g.241764 Transcript_77826/m.241764 type:complete len:268 (-) Transcript_77826:326-1129(-)